MTIKSNDDWKKILSPEAYHITREAGTEPPWTGALLNEKRMGTFHCICCNTALFKSDAKYESGCGWPSFFEAVDEKAITYKEDNSIMGRPRTEILCSNCDAHLGHVFEDGPVDKTGLRYCVNSISMDFESENN